MKKLLTWSVVLLPVLGCSNLSKGKKLESEMLKCPPIEFNITPKWHVEVDEKVQPAEDFYSHVNNGWIGVNSIPEGSHGITRIAELKREVDETIIRIIEELAKKEDLAVDSTEYKIVALYKALHSAVKGELTEALKELLLKIEKLNTGADLQEAVKILVTHDINNNEEPIKYLSDILQALKKLQARKKDTVEHLVKVFQLLNLKEEGLGKNLEEIFKYLENILDGLKETDADLVKVSKNRPQLSVGALKHLLQIGIIAGLYPYLGEDVKSECVALEHSVEEGKTIAVEAANEKDAKKKFGNQNISPQRRALAKLEKMMSDGIGRLLCDNFEEDLEARKAKVGELVEKLKIAFKERIDMQAWISEPLKQAMKEKIDAMEVVIGHFDKRVDYSHLEVTKEDLTNVVIYRTRNKAIPQIEKAEDLIIPAQCYTPLYVPDFNKVFIPASFLLSSFFDPKADSASLYGTMGFLIGHEMAHSLDPEYRFRGKEVNLSNYWALKDNAAYEVKTYLLANYFTEKFKVDGKKKLNENFADLVGLKIAYQAYKSERGRKEDLDSDKKFFISYGSLWASNMSQELNEWLTNNDPHSPEELRVNGTLPLIDEFCKAFNITTEDRLYVPEYVEVTVRSDDKLFRDCDYLSGRHISFLKVGQSKEIPKYGIFAEKLEDKKYRIRIKNCSDLF